MIARPPVAAVIDAGLAASLSQGAGELALPLASDQVERLVAYVRLIEHWNKAYNLTAVRDPRAMVVQHLLDCLAVIKPLRRESGHLAAARLLDVGSGAGLPGVVIAMIQPELRVVCVDSVGKKAAFITQAAAALGLKNLAALHRRVEDLPPADPYDIITSRAFASLADFVLTTRPLLAPGGVWMAMKGKPPHDELGNLGALTFHVEPIVVPQLDAERCLVWLRTK